MAPVHRICFDFPAWTLVGALCAVMLTVRYCSVEVFAQLALSSSVLYSMYRYCSIEMLGASSSLPYVMYCCYCLVEVLESVSFFWSYLKYRYMTLQK